jgi:hypothetical protein
VLTLDQSIRLAASAYLGWNYGSPSLVACPASVVPPAVVWRPGQKTRTVCCVFVGGVLGAVYPAAKWHPGAWALMMVPAVAPWGLVDAVVAAGVGREWEDAPMPEQWYVAQGWSGLVDGKVAPGSRGHQWLQYGPGVMLEATTWTDEDADGKSTDAGAVAWRRRDWTAQVARFDSVRLVALVDP